MRLFQDAAGTIPAYLPGDPVGLVKRMAGTVDASQTVALSRPTLARWPKGGRRNLLTWTEDFSNAVWLKSSVTMEEVAGLPGAFKMTPVAANAPHNIRTARVPSGDPHVASLEVRAAGYSKIALFNYYGVWHGWKGAVFDVATGAIIAGSNPFATIQPLSDGWYRITTPVTATVVDPAIAILDDDYAISSSPYTYSFAANGVSGIDIRHPQLERGDSATPYQRVTTKYDVTEAGVTDVGHLSNDGGDSLPVTLPAGTYGRARVNAAGVVTVDTVVDPINALISDQQVDFILRQGAFTPEEEAKIRAYWARYAA